MTSRFASLTKQDVKKIVEDKDSQTKRSTKVAKELFADYVKGKKLRVGTNSENILCQSKKESHSLKV